MLNKISTKNKFSKVENLSSNEKMLRGTAWLSMGLIISRIIGALYIIPWSIWVGEHFGVANSLFALAYVPYILFLDLATAGFPLAITKQISQLNAQNEYKASITLFKNSLIIMTMIGIVMSSIFVLSAYSMAGSSFPTGNIEDNVYILKSLAPAILILPPISLLRGFFQGFQQMTTPAISQIIEQVVRICYMLASTFFIMKVSHGSIVDAVMHSTLATFFGALSALIFLLLELYRERHYIIEKLKFSTNAIKLSFNDSLKIVIKDSLPFILVSVGTSLLAVIDIYFYSPIMRDFSHMSENAISVSIGWFSANAPKLVGIIGSLTVAITSAAIPSISALYFKKNNKELPNLIAHNISLFAFLVVPSAIGLMIVGPSIYKVFYPSAEGSHVLPVYCINLISIGLMSTFISMIQGMGKYKIAMKSLSILLISKITFIMVFTIFFKENGPGLSVLLASTLTCIYLWDVLYELTKFNKKYVKKQCINIFKCICVMAIVAFIIHTGLDILLPENGKFINFIRVIITGLFGGITYLYMTLYSGIATKIMPDQTIKLKKIFKLK